MNSRSVSNMGKYSIIKDMSEEKPRLLVVDDEADQRESIKSYFSRRNFLVLTSATGRDALALIKEERPDLVMLDMKLSEGLTGKDILKALRQYDKDTKVVMITGDLLGEEEVKEISGLGIVDFLLKPVDVCTLEGVVRKVLQDNYPKDFRFEESQPKADSPETSLRRIVHDLSNVTNDITNKCELYILDTEEGLNKNKSEKERLAEAINVLRGVLKSAERLTDLTKKLSVLKRGNE